LLLLCTATVNVINNTIATATIMSTATMSATTVTIATVSSHSSRIILAVIRARLITDR